MLIPRVDRPQPAGLVAARCNDLVALGVKGNLGYFILMAL
jgi:hypothetical protein